MRLSRSAPIAVSAPLLVGIAIAAAQAPSQPPASPSPAPAAAPAAAPAGDAAGGMTEDEKTLYTLGLMLGRNLPAWSLTPAEMAVVTRGMTDMATGGTPLVDLNTYMPKVQQMSKDRATARAAAEKAKSEPFIAAAAKEPGAVTSPTGLVYRSLQEGTGAAPALTDLVKVHYTGTLIDGKVFDSSVQRGQPAEFPLNRHHPVLDGGPAEDEGGRQGQAGLPGVHRLRRPGPAGRDPAGRHPRLRRGAAGDPAAADAAAEADEPRPAAEHVHARRQGGARDVPSAWDFVTIGHVARATCASGVASPGTVTGRGAVAVSRALNQARPGRRRPLRRRPQRGILTGGDLPPCPSSATAGSRRWPASTG
jgi:FKBP-type peptidyl-prolyl cis-trans isomerase